MLRAIALPYLILEIIALWVFISHYGFLNYVLEVIVSAFIGLSIITRYGFNSIGGVFTARNAGELFGRFGMIFGGFLLFLPGILGDILGVIIIIVSFFIDSVESTQSTVEPADDDIIDVEVIQEEKDNGFKNSN